MHHKSPRFKVTFYRKTAHPKAMKLAISLICRIEVNRKKKLIRMGNKRPKKHTVRKIIITLYRIQNYYPICPPKNSNRKIKLNKVTSRISSN